MVRLLAPTNSQKGFPVRRSRTGDRRELYVFSVYGLLPQRALVLPLSRGAGSWSGVMCKWKDCNRTSKCFFWGAHVQCSLTGGGVLQVTVGMGPASVTSSLLCAALLSWGADRGRKCEVSAARAKHSNLGLDIRVLGGHERGLS